MRFALIFALAMGTALTGICYLFTGQIVRAFLSDTNALSYGVQFVKILLTTSATNVTVPLTNVTRFFRVKGN